ncbi:MAG: DUF4198 domain-containing protein [Campylobacterales bacterium]|nr:DUF4198 domain-containing protein [Campylobacterales bacterium]
MKKLLILSVLVSVFASSLLAHFQLVYTPNTALTRGKNIQLKIVFTHPFADEHTMDMAGVEEFYSITKKKGKVDLRKSLKPITFYGKYDSGKGYSVKYKARKMGDHILVMKPKPYYVNDKDIYIQQITKTVINVAGMPSGWDKDLGLKAEIVPLTKPYSIWAGSTFTGIVKSNGKPVANAEIDVAYLNSSIDMKKNKMGEARYQSPQDSFITLNIKADKDGKFTFGIPKAGFWGFSAVGIGPDTTYDGKPLSQDGVIWVEAKEMK